MGRLKVLNLDIKELKCKSILIDELKSKIDTEKYDIQQVVINIRGKGPPPFIADVDKAIRSVKRYYACNKHLIETINAEQMITKKQLSKILGVSRPTLNKWIHHGFILPTPLTCMKGETFPLDDILRQLIAYKSKK